VSQLKLYTVIKIRKAYFLALEGVTNLKFPEGSDDMVGKKISRNDFDIFIHKGGVFYIEPSYMSAILKK
jgi:hypothetical protein